MKSNVRSVTSVPFTRWALLRTLFSKHPEQCERELVSTPSRPHSATVRELSLGSPNGAHDESFTRSTRRMRQVGSLQNVNLEDQNAGYYGPCSGIVNRAIGKVDADVLVSCEGTIFLFTPITPRAKEWICASVQPDAQWLGASLAVEHRYAADLAAGMHEAGLTLE